MGSSREDPLRGGESLEDGEGVLESFSIAPEWGLLPAGKAGFAPWCVNLVSLEVASLLEDRDGLN